MTHYKPLFYTLLIGTALLTGCGKSEDLSTFAQAEDGTITVVGGTMKLGTYKGLKLTKRVRQATEEEAKTEADAYAVDYIDPVEITDRGIINGDTVTISGTKENGYDIDDIEETFVLGDGTYDSDFETQLLNATTGDTLTFALTEDGQPMSYTITIDKIEAEYTGEITDELVKTYFDVDTTEDYYKQFQTALNENYEAAAQNELYETAYQTIRENSEFYSYADSLWEENYAEIQANYASYMDFFGCDNIEDIYSIFDITDDSIKAAATRNLYDYMITNAIANLEGFTASKEEIASLEEEYMDANGFSSKEELYDVYKADIFPYWVIADKVSTYLLEQADIETVYYTGEE